MNRVAYVVVVVAGLISCGDAARAVDQHDVRFGRDIRPILSEFCVKCHGPSDETREAGLRLDTQLGATSRLKSGGFAIVPGDPQNSKLLGRIRSTDPEHRMPPAETGLSLTDKQIQLIQNWIEQGAKWESHWAYDSPSRPRLPSVMNPRWPINAIDSFTLAQMESRQLIPSPAAVKENWIRRVTFDLTGLPPTLPEVDAFLADDSAEAYERVVDRLLDSPRYGERMALHWLDLARYADTHGYHIDSHRDMWRWREWVIAAFNENMSFDQFTVWQIAGDLLQNPTGEQRLATGFNRNHMINFEGGAIAEEYQTEYVVDRVVTTSTVWLGQTMLCARCHDHKYDPFTQRDFYRLFAYFNNIAEEGLDGRKGNAKPFLLAPTDLQNSKLTELRDQLAKVGEQIKLRVADSVADQAKWETKFAAAAVAKLKPPSDMQVYLPLDESDGETAQDFGAIKKKFLLKVGPLKGLPFWGPGQGKFGGGLWFGADSFVDAGDVAGFERTDSFSCGAWIKPTTHDPMTILSRMSDTPSQRGYDLYLADREVFVHVNHDREKNAIRVSAPFAYERREWNHVMMTYDGSSQAAGVAIFINGKAAPTVTLRDSLSETIKHDAPLRIGSRNPGESFRGMLDDVRIFARKLSPTEVALLAGSNPIAEIVKTPVTERSDAEHQMLRQHYLEFHDERYKRLVATREALRERHNQVESGIPTSMVMHELETPRETFILKRGNYQHRTEPVAPGTPVVLHALPSDAPPNRLGLAQWLVDRRNPLVARVAVNRFWQMYFGDGLVRTPEDFGTRGQPPTHPELLDWLAVEFMDSGWDIKHMQRLIVLSATYRQSSGMTAESFARDPENRWLARGPRFRLQSEFIRDNALFVSGLLTEELGGRSVFPYQPPGLWEEISFNPADFSAQVYKQSFDADLYRRSMYTFWKRTAPPPAMAVFGAPDREVCTVRRPRPNTPLDALVLMNDPTYIEAARELARRMMTETGREPRERIEFGFRLATARRPTERETNVLLGVFAEQLAEYQSGIGAATQLLHVGESRSDATLEISEFATYTIMASLILNLHETITKG